MGAQARVTVMTKSPRVVSNLTWNVSGAFSLSIEGRNKVRSKVAGAAAFPPAGAVDFGFAGARAGVCASVWIASGNKTTTITATNFFIAVLDRKSTRLNSSH